MALEPLVGDFCLLDRTGQATSSTESLTFSSIFLSTELYWGSNWACSKAVDAGGWREIWAWAHNGSQT